MLTLGCSRCGAGISPLPSDRPGEHARLPAGLKGNWASQSGPFLQRRHSWDPAQGNKPLRAMPFTLFGEKQSQTQLKNLLPTVCGPHSSYSITGLPFLQTIALSINLVCPSPLKVVGISFLYYYFALSMNQPLVDHANGIINLRNSKKIYGALRFHIGRHGSEQVSVYLGGGLGLALASLWN